MKSVDDWTPTYAFDQKQERAWSPLLSNRGLKRVLGRKRRSVGLSVYPGIKTDDPQQLHLMERLATELSGQLRAETDEYGAAGANAIASDFYALLTVGGYGMDPISTPPVDNSPIRKELKLSDDFVSQRHREIAMQVLSAMLERPLPAKVPIRRQASTGSPDYVNDVPKKKQELRKALSEIDSILSLVERGDLQTLFTEYNAPIIHTIGERSQADSIIINDDGTYSSKPREVNDELAARTAFAEGRRFIANKAIMRDGQIVRNHFAMRRRTVYGMAFVVNYLVASFFASWREHYLTEYSYTWKHRTPESILEKMRKFDHLVGFDVKNFDQTAPSFLVDLFCQYVGQRSDERLGKLIALMFSAPYIMPYTHIAGSSSEPQNPLFGADPFDVGSFTMRLGLPSGISCNPDFGKFAMVTQYLCICDDYFHNVVETGAAAILRGDCADYALLNMGDDCVICTNNGAFADHVKHARYNATYFAVAQESPISFLGNIPYRDHAGDLQLAPNLSSFFLNWLVPEHGIESYQRRNFWAVGDRERRAHYSSAPAYPEAYAVYEELFRATWGRTPSSITAEYYDSQRAFGTLSFIDALVLQNPDYLHYRFDESDVSPDVLEQLVTSLPAEEVWLFTKSFFK